MNEVQGSVAWRYLHRTCDLRPFWWGNWDIHIYMYCRYTGEGPGYLWSEALSCEHISPVSYRECTVWYSASQTVQSNYRRLGLIGAPWIISAYPLISAYVIVGLSYCLLSAYRI